jgi:epoxyqueuosine reductase
MVQEVVKQILTDQGIHHFGWARLEKPLSLSFYEKWLDEGMNGDMDYLRRHLPQKSNPSLLLDAAKFAIVIGVPYAPEHPQPISLPVSNLKVAKYAKGLDYHDWLKDKLDAVVVELQARFSNAEFRTFTDSGPVLERDLAYRAGLGWVGKNTCLIDSARGSFFLIGEIFTTLELDAIAVHPDRCGTCTRCIDACPTGALLGDRKMDARKCISYLNIESKTNPPVELRSKIQDWFFGCDICQDVCPWNHKALDAPTEVPPENNRELVLEDLRWILMADEKTIQAKLKWTALSRARALGLRRNALIVAANIGAREILDLVVAQATDERLGELAKWAASQIHQKE